MIYPVPDKLNKVSGKYALVIAAAKRAHQLSNDAPPLVNSRSSNPLTVALEEIAQGLVMPVQTNPHDAQLELTRPTTAAASTLGLISAPVRGVGEETEGSETEPDELLQDADTEIETLDQELVKRMLGVPDDEAMDEEGAEGELSEDAALSDGSGGDKAGIDDELPF
jgi:DNA-directed RNA polymerase subunit omega